MHSPLSTQALAHWREVCGPAPVRTMSSTPAIVAGGSASAMPAAPVIGQASKHLPHLVQASSMVSTREFKAVSKAPVMAAAPAGKQSDGDGAPTIPPGRSRWQTGRRRGPVPQPT
jgi:hypothetical protein